MEYFLTKQLFSTHTKQRRASIMKAKIEISENVLFSQVIWFWRIPT